jgi:hypothetical protein
MLTTALPTIIALAFLTSSTAPLGRSLSLFDGAEGAAVQSEEQTTDELGEVTATVNTLLGELASLGFIINREDFTIEISSVEACGSDLDDQQDAFFDESYFTMAWHFYGALGVPLGEGPESCRTFVSDSLARTFVAYYGVHRDALVLVDSFMGQLSRNDYTLLHELGHTWQDQQSSLGDFFSEGQRSLERTRIKQCVVEGEAEVIALRATLARDGKELNELDPEQLESESAALFAGQGLASLYSIGRRYVLGVMVNGDADREKLFRELPSSTEQLLHPEKFGQDEPVDVLLFEKPEAWATLELVHEDTIGELGLFSVLSAIGQRERASRIGSTGWDGDRLQFYSGEGETLILWRIVLDREVDAEQLAAAFTPSDRVGTQSVGQVFHWVSGSDPLRVKDALKRMAQLPAPSANEDDASSTAAIEADIPSEPTTPTIEGGRWIVPAYNLSMQAPKGWTAEDVAEQHFLFGPQRADFRSNINITTYAPARDMTAAEILKENQDGIEAAPSLDYLYGELREAGGRTVVHIGYGMQAQGMDLRLRVLLIPMGSKQLILTGTTLASQADEFVPVLDAALLSAKLGR